MMVARVGPVLAQTHRSILELRITPQASFQLLVAFYRRKPFATLYTQTSQTAGFVAVSQVLMMTEHGALLKDQEVAGVLVA